MSNVNFKGVLEKFNNNPRLILENYTYDKGEDIYTRLDSIKEDDVVELNNILNKIVLWKINRTVVVSDETLIALNKVRDIKNLADVINGNRKEEVERLLSNLINSKGVRLAMASTFLHFFNPDIFPIFDQRAYRVVNEKDYQAPTALAPESDAKLNMEYLKKCDQYFKTELSGKGIRFSEIDKYLYQLDKEAGNKVKNY